MDCGRVLNPKLARNQVMGGITFGLGMALLEQVPYDAATAQLDRRVLPAHPRRPPRVRHRLRRHADYGLGPIGVRGIGEIGTCGVPAAIANAIHHATGKRLRDLPITLEHLMTPFDARRRVMNNVDITLSLINGDTATARHRCAVDAARSAAGAPAPDRHQEGLRSRTVRRLHRGRRRRAGRQLPDAGGIDRRCRRRTVEGIADGDDLHPIQRAFIEHDGFQCGYCTSGQISSAHAMLREHARGDLSHGILRRPAATPSCPDASA